MACGMIVAPTIPTASVTESASRSSGTTVCQANNFQSGGLIASSIK